MFSKRSLHLYKISVNSLWHRIRHDFARELVVAICAAVLIATFGYIFNDFLNVKVKELSISMRSTFATAVAIFGMLMATSIVIRSIRSARYTPASLGELALRLGEDPKFVKGFLWLRTCSTTIAVYIITWTIICRYLVKWEPSTILLSQTGLLIIVGLAQFLPPPRFDKERSIDPLLPPHWHGSRLTTLAKWRLVQIIFRNRLTQSCLFIAVLAGFFAAFLAMVSVPDVAIFFVCLVGGCFGSMALAFQLQEDLNYAWAERSMGIDHRSFERAYEVIGAILGVAIGIIPGVAIFIASPDLAGLSLATKGILITWIPFFTMPCVMFQIDGRRPALQAIMNTVMGLMLGTAILASWLGLILLPVFRYYVSGVQQGRFYRA